jgi:glycosyltransferase involved in cell wall biosynthesis
MMTLSRKKLVIVVSHPIQHFVPFYRALAQEEAIDLTVIFCSRIGVEPYFDKAMNTTIAWKMDLLGGYNHVFLPEADRITSTSPRNINNPSVGAELARQTPDTVLIYGYNFLTSLRALFWCRRNRVPVMMISDSELKTVRSIRTETIKKLLLPRILRQFDAFLTVGDCNEDYYAHYGVPRNRLFRSPFTIDEDTYQTAYRNRTKLRAARRKELGIADDEVMILTVGKLSRRKHAADVVEAARFFKVAGNPAKLRFVLVGNGEEMERLEKIVADEDLPVLMSGFVNVDRLPEYYCAADMILHPFSRDPHPLVMSEGACIGLPLLISDRVGAAGPTDIARPGENAKVFPVGDVAALVDRAKALAADPERRAQMSARSREIFDELDMRRSIHGVLDAIAFLAASKGK